MTLEDDITENIAFVATVILLEDVVLILAFIVTIISLITILKGSKFHPNLRILFINQFAGNICFILVR